MEKLAGCIVLWGALVVLYIIRFAIVFWGWNLVLVPIAHLPNITFLQAVLVSFLLGLVFGGFSIKKSE